MKFKVVQVVRHKERIINQTGFPGQSEVGKLKSGDRAENALKSYITDLLLREINGQYTIYPNHEESSLIERVLLGTLVIILNASNLTIIGALGLNRCDLNKPKVDQV